MFGFVINAKCSDCKHLVDGGNKKLCRCGKGKWCGVSYNYSGEKISMWDNCRDYNCKYTYEQLYKRKKIMSVFKGDI